jgi:hypothetical protein
MNETTTTTIIAQGVTPCDTQAEIRNEPCKGRPNQKRRYVPVTCACGHTWKVRADYVRRVTMCGRCQRRVAGKRGYEAAKGTPAFLNLSTLIKRQREYPSTPEKRVIGWLTELHIGYAHQHLFQCGEFRYVIDFVRGNRAIEVVGYWHAKFKRGKDARLQELWQGELLFVDADQIMRDPAGTKALIQAFITGSEPQCNQ